MPPDELAELARDYFGEDRVQVTQRLDEALDLAVSLADAADADASAAGQPGTAAVLVTGSVVTAGDAQLLLTPGSAVGTSVNAGYATRQGDPQ
jgi:dihydrofolate synthase/folylpolyglutamate synthase